MDRAIGRAIDQGITYFDTAAAYGDGMSETNLGRALRTLNARVTVGTKVRIRGGQRGDIGAATTASVEESLRRLGRDSVDILHLHEPITREGAPPAFTADAILHDAVPVLQRLRDQGKFRHYGITGLGDAPEVGRTLRERGFSTAQMPYNILNPNGLRRCPQARRRRTCAGASAMLRPAISG